MQPPLVIRPLTADERALLATGLRSSAAFTVRRGHSLLASAEGPHTTTMAQTLRCHDQTVRKAIHAFNQRGVAALRPQSSRTHRTPRGLRGRRAGAPTGPLASTPPPLGPGHQPLDPGAGRRGQLRPGADPPPGQGRDDSPSPQAAGRALEARPTLAHQSRPRLRPKKTRRERLIRLIQPHPTWALGWAEEVWWSRLAPPDQDGWTAPDAVPTRPAWERPKAAPDPKAVACYGRLGRHPPRQREPVLRRFVAGRPVSAVTTAFLAWCRARLAAHGVTALVVSWDHASWHISQEVRAWVRAHHQTVKRTGQGVRIVPCRLPTTSPWLNPIEPTWVHGTRAVSDPNRLLRAAELDARVYAS